MPVKFANYLNLTKLSFSGLVAKLHNLQKNKGFTLIELLIVVAIIGILSTVVLANYNSFGNRQAVKNAAEQLKSELRKNQTFAIAGQKNPRNGNPDTFCYTDPGELDYYEIFVTDNDYFVASLKNIYRVRLICPPVSPPDTIVAIKKIFKNEAIIVEDVGSESNSCISNVVGIFFKTLNQPTNFFCPGASLPISSVYIRISNGSTKHEITVTKTGEINVKKL